MLVEYKKNIINEKKCLIVIIRTYLGNLFFFLGWAEGVGQVKCAGKYKKLFLVNFCYKCFYFVLVFRMLAMETKSAIILSQKNFFYSILNLQSSWSTTIFFILRLVSGCSRIQKVFFLFYCLISNHPKIQEFILFFWKNKISLFVFWGLGWKVHQVAPYFTTHPLC